MIAAREEREDGKWPESPEEPKPMPQTPEAWRPKDRGLLSAKRLPLCACSWELPSLKLSSPTAKGGDNNHA